MITSRSDVLYLYIQVYLYYQVFARYTIVGIVTSRLNLGIFFYIFLYPFKMDIYHYIYTYPYYI